MYLGEGGGEEEEEEEEEEKRPERHRKAIFEKGETFRIDDFWENSIFK